VTDHPHLIPVPFRGATLHLVDHNGEPYAAMRPIVEAMGLAWQGQFDKIKTRYSTCVMEIMTQLPGDVQRRSLTCLPLRKLAGWLMTIHANKVAPELRATIRAYQAECDDALWDYWTKGRATRPRSPESYSPAYYRDPSFNPSGSPYLADSRRRGDPLAYQVVRRAVNRKANALSRDAFEHNRDILEDAMRREGNLGDPEAALDWLRRFGSDHGQQNLFDVELLRRVATQAAAACQTLERQQETLDQIMDSMAWEEWEEGDEWES
jgi:hypothetical protein